MTYHPGPPYPFRWGRHHRAYLAHCNRKCSKPLEVLAEECGYANRGKFSRRRMEWVAGKTAVPVRFLTAINANLEVLRECVALDVAEFHAALREQPMPRAYHLRYSDLIFYTAHDLPEDITLLEACTLVQEVVDGYARDVPEDETYNGMVLSPPVRGYLEWPGFKTIFFHASRPWHEVLWEPRMDVADGRVDFGSPGGPLFRWPA